ncbi:hypothetical protein D187_002273 [Cystobacter fuscus DSM 2262]|uniref:Uncharacterized protein n=1 Tax=Cystobacter fuscus (strain ATCC 25194 / DSM 2262 / NBRC 100088 / M29) TaxID=1242864 RepID=S9PD27_CYSF2|nr:hypothetical protein D187_002273 [Cystobacter fuscus DSM 2262]
MDYDAYVAENFEEHDGQPRFLTGSGAASTTEISGENWKGLQTEYFLGNTCFNVIGRANAEHAFVLDFCDEEASFGRQLPVLRGLLRVLRVR